MPIVQIHTYAVFCSSNGCKNSSNPINAKGYATALAYVRNRGWNTVLSGAVQDALTYCPACVAAGRKP